MVFRDILKHTADHTMGQKLTRFLTPAVPLTAHPAMRMPMPIRPRRSGRIQKPTIIFTIQTEIFSRHRRTAPAPAPAPAPVVAVARIRDAPPSIRAVHPPLEITHIIRELNLPQMEEIAKSSPAIGVPEDRIALATKKFANNKHSDEYYTRSESWRRFVYDAGLAGKTVWEPFFGDGSSRAELAKIGVTQIGKEGDFWENITAPDCPTDFIMSNPPFSFKWEIMETLLERKRSFALILPWQTFYQTNARHLARLHEKYGGEYLRYGMRGEEVEFYSPKDRKMVPIGTSILLWTF
jgi:hypothetical protein